MELENRVTGLSGVKRTWSIYNFIFALKNAADFLENEQWPDADEGVQAAANMEAAKRIRKCMDRLVNKHFGGWT